jgi:hypothetical protein
VTTKTFTRMVLLALGVAAATAGCGSSSAPAESSPPTSTTTTPTGTSTPTVASTPTPAPGETANPAGISKLSACTLMTQSDAASITGMPGVKRLPTSDRIDCGYYEPGINGGAAELYIEMPLGPQLSLVRTSLAGELNGSPNIVAVPGIGDAAYDYFDATTAGLAFEKIGIVVVILSSPPGVHVRSGSAQLPVIQKLATSIAGQL